MTMIDGSPPHARFSATEAALAGFRLMKREPKLWALLAAMVLVLHFALAAAMVAFAGPEMMALRTPGGGLGPAAITAAFARLAPVALAGGLLALAVYVIAFVLVFRARLGPGRAGWTGWGGAVLRQLGVMLLFALVTAVIYLGLLLTAALVMLAGRSVGVPWLGALAVLAVFSALLLLVVRLSLAGPLTYDAGRVDLFGAWPLTRRRFWPLLGAYVISALICGLLWLTLLIVLSAMALAVGGPAGVAELMRPDTTTLARYFSPLRWPQLVLGSAVYAVQIAAFAGAAADAYAQITALGPALDAAPQGRAGAPDTTPRFGNG